MKVADLRIGQVLVHDTFEKEESNGRSYSKTPYKKEYMMVLSINKHKNNSVWSVRCLVSTELYFVVPTFNIAGKSLKWEARFIRTFGKHDFRLAKIVPESELTGRVY